MLRTAFIDLRLGLLLGTFCVYQVYSICLLSRPCPCGSSGKSYLRCFETLLQQYSCESWADCETCEDYNEFCLTCPPGRYGLTCKNERKEMQKRDLTQQRKNLSTANENECTFRITGNISFNCTTDMEGKVTCDINCNEKCKGRYKCFPGKGWDPVVPSCQDPKESVVLPTKGKRVSCPDPGTPKNGGRRDLDGHYIPSRSIFWAGEVLVFFCDDRHAGIQGSTRLTCKSDGKWDGTLPPCVSLQKDIEPEMSCQHPGVFENGIIKDFQTNTEKFPIGTNLRFICREGFKREGPDAIYCLRNLSWSEKPPVCKSVSTTTTSASLEPFCQRPEPIKNGFIQNDVSEIQSFPVGSVLSFKCLEGFELIGAETLNCLRSVDNLGYWSDILPGCRDISTTTTSHSIDKNYCQNPGSVENGIFEYYPPETQRFPIGTALKFRCLEGYELEGLKYVYCILPGKWSASLPNCRLIPTTPLSEVSCGHPGTVTNGMFEGMSRSSFLVGTALTFRCNSGTQIEGHQSIYCLRTGKWSAPPPVCRSILNPIGKETKEVSRLTCRHPGVIENGETEPDVSKSNELLVGEQIKFKCKEGFTIVGLDTIHCESNGELSSVLPVCRRSINIPECGRVFTELYKSTGKFTRSDWPWTVGLSTVMEDDTEKMFCGGALLNSKTVVTAAHCVTGTQNGKVHFSYRRPISEQVRKISRIIIHPEYDHRTHANDIALIKFDHHVYYDSRTQPICLPTPNLNSSGKNLLPGTTTFVTGYGLELTTNQSSTPAFKVFEFPVQPEKVCEPVCKDQELVACSPSTFCAGYLMDTKECIYGGTPLVVYHKEKSRYTLEGLVTRAESARNTWNGRCKHAEIYTTFTNVTYFMPFIFENLL